MNTRHLFLNALVATAAVMVSPLSQATYPGANGKLVFAHNITYDTQINLAVMNSDGTAMIDVSTMPGQSIDPAWSPNGKRIAFALGPACCYWNIWLMKADGSEPTQLTNSVYADRYPTWSPDGVKLAFTRGIGPAAQIYVINADGTNEHNLTHSSSSDFQAVWSPQGDRIAFISARDGNREVYVMNTDGTQQMRLTQTPSIEEDPKWSPDGKKIVFKTDRDGNNEIYVMNADGSKQTRLTNNPADDNTPAWSPDGKKIVFARGYGQDGRLYVMNSDGSGQEQISSISGWFADWQSIPLYTYPSLLSLGDIDHDTNPELAVVSYDATLKKSRATVRNAKTGLLISQIAFNGQYTPVKANTINDLNNNGASEIAVLGVRDSDQAVQVEVRDSLSGVKIRAVPFPATWLPLDLGIVRNVKGPGTAALAVLQQSATALRVQLTDAKSGAQLRTIPFSSGYDGVDLVVLGDLNGNQTKDLAVLLDNTDPKGADKVEIRDSGNGQLIRSISYGSGAKPKQLASVVDANGNGFAELAVLRDNTARVAVKDAQTGLAVNTLDYSLSQPYKLAGVPDAVRGVSDLALLGVRAGDGQIRADVQNILTDSLVGKAVYDNYGTTVGVISIPDINGNGVAELVRLREQPGPQKLFAEIRDGRTGKWLQGMYF